MATFTFNTLNELLAYLQTEIGPNGTQAITGQRHQDAVLTMAQSLVNIIASVPPSTVNQFPPYDADEVYGGGVEVVVRHANKLWLFVHASNQVGVTPGSNGLVWQGVSASELAHIRDRDQYLDFGGPNEVSASALRSLLGQQSKWISPVHSWNVVSGAAADAASHTRVIVANDGTSGAFVGHENELAVKVGELWLFEPVPLGAFVLTLSTDNILCRYHSGWFSVNLSIPSLAQVMTVGGETAGPLYVKAAFVRRRITINHLVSGAVAPSLYNSSAFDINVSADVTFTPSGFYNGGEWRLVFRGVSGGSIVFASNVVFVSGAVAPTSIAAGQSCLLRCLGSVDGSKLIVEQVIYYND